LNIRWAVTTGPDVRDACRAAAAGFFADFFGFVFPDFFVAGCFFAAFFFTAFLTVFFLTTLFADFFRATFFLAAMVLTSSLRPALVRLAVPVTVAKVPANPSGRRTGPIDGAQDGPEKRSSLRS
jgi:hypothetical protein